MSVDYVIEKYDAAIDALANTDVLWQDRLKEAYREAHVVMNWLRDMPPDLAERTTQMFDAMTCVKAKADEGTFFATLHVMSEQEGARIIHEFCSIRNELFARFRANRE